MCQVLSVSQQETYPILFNYRFPGSKSSLLSTLCPTGAPTGSLSNPHTILYNVLIDGKMNHQVNQVEMPKNIVMVEPDGSEVNVSRWLKPLNDRVGRSNRPIFDVVETETSLIYSFQEKISK